MARIKCDHCNESIKLKGDLAPFTNDESVSITWTALNDVFEAKTLHFYICENCSKELFSFLTRGIKEEEGEP